MDLSGFQINSNFTISRINSVYSRAKKIKNMQKNMPIRLIKFVILLGFACTFFSFSNPLQKQVWKIEKVTYDYKKTQKNGAGSVAKAGTETNVGTFTFNTDGTGSYSYTIDGMEITGMFKLDDRSSTRTFTYSSGTDQKESIIRNTYIVVKE